MASRPSIPVRPAAAALKPQTFDPAYPPQVGTPGAPEADDAPPSYEDAMADDLSPADGPRREYRYVLVPWCLLLKLSAFRILPLVFKVHADK